MINSLLFLFAGHKTTHIHTYIYASCPKKAVIWLATCLLSVCLSGCLSLLLCLSAWQLISSPNRSYTVSTDCMRTGQEVRCVSPHGKRIMQLPCQWVDKTKSAQQQEQQLVQIQIQLELKLMHAGNKFVIA